jgi:glycosyltransferase involved in cell wall biosynthesis
VKNILHITSEISKKNFSISSLLFYVFEQSKDNKLFNSFIFCSKFEHKLKNKNIIVKNIGWTDFLKLEKILLKNLSRFDVFHVHGLWAPIQFYTIILCIIHSRPLVIHSHGMMLTEAINEHGNYKRIFKKIALYILEIISLNKNNILFIAITDQELKYIKKLFPNLEIKLIKNPIPFKKEVSEKTSSVLNFNKSLVFFGRIHPHKNIVSIIKFFLESNLSEKGWILNIYGIKDDPIYLKKIQYLIADRPSVKMLLPVFGEEKQKIMKESWANILISKSEVLSFSLLESGLHGLPTILNRSIETLPDDKCTIKVPMSKKEVIKKFINISNWSQAYRASLYKKTKNFFTKYQKKNQNVFFKNLALSYKMNLNNYSTIKTGNNLLIDNFYLTSIVHAINLFFPSIILFFSFFYFQTSLTADIGLVSSIFLTIVAIFSGNIRLISVKYKNLLLLYDNLFFRIIFSILVLIIFFVLLFKTFYFDNKILIFLISSTIMSLWCFEMVLSIYEINKNFFKQLMFLFIHFFFLVLLYMSFALKEDLYIELTLGAFSVFLLIISFLNIRYKNSFNWRAIIIFYNKTILLSYLSSLSITASSLFWRFYIYFTFPKEIAAAFFIAFALASFPGTLFNNVLGPAYFSNKITVNNKIKNFFKISFLILVAYTALTYDYLDANQYMTSYSSVILLKILKFSLIGTFLMTFAMYQRHNLFFEKKNNTERLFYRDIFYGITLVFIMPLLDIMAGSSALIFSYFCGAIIAVLFYSTKLFSLK